MQLGSLNNPAYNISLYYNRMKFEITSSSLDKEGLSQNLPSKPKGGKLESIDQLFFYRFNQVPVDDQVVTITKPILLDTATARLGGIEIRDGGRLVFSPSASPIALTTR